ncbi:hypothetical protein E2P81_ATG06352 [Venturia nashicola]|uniref:Uncharacterized protein n=1 Tax=Venturia nashicola TaxID=86259 RepID=A0A4Z1NRW5_9PEZI|nr:hypothetical protein E6O75_ATG06507 [Venturia nashicola]TLD28006.1 hypothetical protein E2P81_ATG06352 [Venturia nashicola]
MSHQPPPYPPTDTPAAEVPLPETPAAEIPLPETPAREIPLPNSRSASPSPSAKYNKNDESHLAKNPHRGHLHNVSPETAIKLKNTNAKNPFTAPETASGWIRKRTSPLLSQAMQTNKEPAAFTSATEISLPENPADDLKSPTPLKDQYIDNSPQPDEPILNVTPTPNNALPATPASTSSPPNGCLFDASTSGSQPPKAASIQSTNISHTDPIASQTKPNPKPLPSSETSSILFTPSSSDEEDSRVEKYLVPNSSSNPAVGKAQDGIPRRRKAVVVRVPIVSRSDEVAVVTMSWIVTVLILCLVALVGGLFGAGLSYYLR